MSQWKNTPCPLCLRGFQQVLDHLLHPVVTKREKHLVGKTWENKVKNISLTSEWCKKKKLIEAANNFGSNWAHMPFLHRLRGPLEVRLVLAGPAVTQQTISLCPSQQWRAPSLVANRSPLPPRGGRANDADIAIRHSRWRMARLRPHDSHRAANTHFIKCA